MIFVHHRTHRHHNCDLKDHDQDHPQRHHHNNHKKSSTAGSDHNNATITDPIMICKLKSRPSVQSRQILKMRQQGQFHIFSYLCFIYIFRIGIFIYLGGGTQKLYHQRLLLVGICISLLFTVFSGIFSVLMPGINFFLCFSTVCQRVARSWLGKKSYFEQV